MPLGPAIVSTLIIIGIVYAIVRAFKKQKSN